MADFGRILFADRVEVGIPFHRCDVAYAGQNFDVLDVEFFFQDFFKLFDNRYFRRVGRRHAKKAQRLTVFHLVLVTDITRQSDNALYRFNLAKQFRIFVDRRHFFPVCKVHGKFARQHLVNFFGNDGRNGRKQLGHVHQNVVQRFVRIFLVLREFRTPETAAATTDIPVGQAVQQGRDRPNVFVHLVVIHAGTDGFFRVVEFRQNPLIEQVIAVGRNRFFGMETVDIRVGNEEVASIPVRQNELLVRILDARIIKQQVPDEHRLGLIQVQTESIRAILFHQFHRVGVVLGRLGQFFAVLCQNRTMYDTVLESRSIKERHRQNVQVIEPATDLARVFYDEVAREVAFKPFLVFERVMLLREGYAAAFKPAVQNFGYTLHQAAAMGAFEGDFVQILSVQVVGANAACLFDFVNAAEHRFMRTFVALPNGNGGTPITVTGDIPVTSAFQPVAETSVFHGFGHPVDPFVEFNQAILDLADVEVVRIHRLVDKGTLTTPTMGIVMLNRTIRNSDAVVVQETDDNGVHFDNRLFFLDGIEVRNFFGELPLAIYGVNQRNSVLFARPVVVFPERRSGVYDTNTFFRTNVIGGHNTESAFRLLVRKVREQGFIGRTNKVSALAFFHDFGLLAEHFVELGKGVFARHQDTVANVDERIIEFFPYRQAKVGRQRPRGRRPSQQVHGLFVFRQSGTELRNHPSVLTGTGRVRFSRIRNRKRSFTMGTIRGYAVITIDKPLVVAGFERPHNAFHEGRRHGLVSVVIIYPTRHLFYVFLPRFVVGRNDFETLIVKRADTERAFNFIFVVDAKQGFRLVFDGQAVAIPAPNAGNFVAAHRPVARKHILDKGYKHRTVMGFTRGERGAVVENVFLFRSLVYRTFENLFIFPKVDDVLLKVAKIGFCRQFLVFHKLLLKIAVYNHKGL